jgi:Phosphotransferase enzyme family
LIETSAVEAALGRNASRIERRPHEYRTSHQLEALDVVLEDGNELRLLLKDLRRSNLAPQALAAKPAFLFDPQREAAAYRLLAPARLGTPVCFAAGDDWVLLERVGGELWQHGDVETWSAAAQWLAALHTYFADNPPSTDHLVVYDRRYLTQWMGRAEAWHPEVQALRAAHRHAVDLLCALPQTLVHGEFYASNVMVDGARIAPVDWEAAGIGPGALDVAALVTGWDGRNRQRMIDAYGRASDKHVAAAQLHLAIQWLGWAEHWVPPPEHARDWLAEARSASDRLGT